MKMRVEKKKQDKERWIKLMRSERRGKKKGGDNKDHEKKECC